MNKPHTSQDLYSQLSYIRYLFDHERQRDNLLSKRTPSPGLPAARPLAAAAAARALALVMVAVMLTPGLAAVHRRLTPDAEPYGDRRNGLDSPGGRQVFGAPPEQHPTAQRLMVMMVMISVHFDPRGALTHGSGLRSIHLSQRSVDPPPLHLQ